MPHLALPTAARVAGDPAGAVGGADDDGVEVAVVLAAEPARPVVPGRQHGDRPLAPGVVDGGPQGRPLDAVQHEVGVAQAEVDHPRAMVDRPADAQVHVLGPTLAVRRQHPGHDDPRVRGHRRHPPAVAGPRGDDAADQGPVTRRVRRGGPVGADRAGDAVGGQRHLAGQIGVGRPPRRCRRRRRRCRRPGSAARPAALRSAGAPTAGRRTGRRWPGPVWERQGRRCRARPPALLQGRTSVQRRAPVPALAPLAPLAPAEIGPRHSLNRRLRAAT